MNSYVITDGGVTAIIQGKRHTIARDNPVYWTVRDAIQYRKPEEEISKMFQTAEAVKAYSGDEIEVKEGTLSFNGKEIHNVVVDRIYEFMTQRLPFDPLLRFLRRLLRNPEEHSVQELYKFLELHKCPITEDGCFLGYKGVRTDYLDQHSGRFDNHPGNYLSMPRNACDPNWRNHCSSGFHVGSLEYAYHFGPKCVIVKVDPADVVSVPPGEESWKLRTCKYKVLCDYHGPLPKTLHTDRPYEDEIVSSVEVGRW